MVSPINFPKLLERVKGIEPSQPAWKAGALPLSYTRVKLKQSQDLTCKQSKSGGSRIRTCEG
jgi:hypothetical protein